MKPLAHIALLLLLACTAKDAPPPGALDREKFVRVLTGSLLIEARLNHEMVIDKRVDSPIAQYYEEMFKQQGITEQQFKTTYDYYVQHPQELKKAYEDVLNDLQQRADSTAR